MKTESWDVVVVGSGIAGLTMALSVAPLRTLVLTKTRALASGSSHYAQGGIAFPVDEADIPSHIEDTLHSGAGACDESAVKTLIGAALASRQWLEAEGVQFDRSEEGHYRLGKEGAHSRRRIFHVHGDSTGREMVRVLMAKAEAARHITLRTQVMADRVVLDDQKNVAGLVVLDADQGEMFLSTGQLILAGGGMGQLFSRTTNPAESTGDVLALALQAGAQLADLEMIQFHPTGLDVSQKDPAAVQFPLLSEALRGEGATLEYANGLPLPVPHAMGFLGPRDVVARAIFQALQLGRPVFLDARKIVGGDLAQRFPTVYQICRNQGLDPLKQRLPVTPVVHYSMGGVKTDTWGQTGVRGLFVVGESASTGIHGANRLASNSLLECIVFARRAAEVIRTSPAGRPFIQIQSPGLPDEVNPFEGFPAAVQKSYRLALQKILFGAAGPVRDATGLEHGLEALSDLVDDVAILSRKNPPADPGSRPSDYETRRLALENRNLFQLAPLVLQSALANRHSLGAHYRRDFP